MSPPDLRKAAVLLMSLPDDEAARLTAQLSPTQLERVSAQIVEIDMPACAEVETVVHDFAVARAHDSFDVKPFDFLHAVDGRSLLKSLIDEQPQTIALIVSHLPAAQAAEILGGLSRESQLDVALRIATMGPVEPDVVQEVAEGLDHRISNVIGRPTPEGHHDALASGKALKPASRSRSTKLAGPCVQ
jgi:flagellar motor switch protein FliG